MKKLILMLCCLLCLCGCSKRIENPGPPQLTILEDAVIEVNQEGFVQDQLRSCFKAVDAKGKTLPDENVIFMTNVNVSILGTSFVKIKAVDENGYYDIKTLKVTTVDHTAPTFRLPALTPVFLTSEQPTLFPKGLGLQMKDNFNKEQTLIANSRILSGSPDYTVPGSYTLTLSTSDSAGNSARTEMEIKVSEDPLEKGRYLYDKLSVITQGSDDYFIFGQNEEELQRTEILNYDAILDDLCTADGRAILENSGFQNRILKENELTCWNWNSVQADQAAVLRSELNLIKDTDETLTFEVTTTWNLEGQEVTETHPLILKKDNGLWKIDDFWYPFDGPEKQSDPTAVPKPSATPKS